MGRFMDMDKNCHPSYRLRNDTIGSQTHAFKLFSILELQVCKGQYYGMQGASIDLDEK